MFHSRLERSQGRFHAKVVPTIVNNVENEVKKVVKTTHILGEGHVEHRVAMFYRKELKYGKLLGAGSFCEAHELKDITLLKQYESASKAPDYQTNRKKMAAIARKAKKSPYVVKHLRPSLLKDQKAFIEAAGELILEAKYLASMTHPNIIGIHAVATAGAKAYSDGSHDGYFVVLDALRSTLFDDIIQWKVQGAKAKASLGYRLQVVHDLATALEYLHGRNLVYRDLKPGNVGFDLNGRVKLFDFGLLAEIPRGGYLTQRSGTLRYMAPDCYLGKYNCKVDVYSVTVILWEVLTTRHYFDKLENLAHVKEIMAGNREPLDKTWPSGLRDVMTRSWIGDPNRRLSMREFRSGLDEEINKLRKAGKHESFPLSQPTKVTATRKAAISDFQADASSLCGVNEMFA
mmetsp:Transcript_3050/g.4506  ORF Transcript_3050/g.4506 Transcript_3050/m.4506 type:complete len:402 (+) Transcript_3050:112-1317(+)|eukprot:CAMPEP_0194216428 /NCGR_PEP_ID=MMETSP0156-20130528/18949_1 /TAXON_ID=33649 /ORGANISM="Thalassionema nitzschioides, Strain L26-B" /LENGTH=401 /DNA_ID=CAMNT_0038945193 /DNA_START=66 /DNA_END=1271 /DNA_ORIENTATION=-